MGAQAKLILWLISLAVVLGALFGAYRYGRHVEGLARDSQQLGKMKQEVKAGNRLAAADNAAATDAAAKEAERSKSSGARSGRVERSIATHVEYVACALSASDLAELNAAIEGNP